jgi:two-component system, NtrC family, sensor kinase
MADFTPSKPSSSPAVSTSPAAQEPESLLDPQTRIALANFQLELTHLGLKGDLEGVQARLVRGVCWLLDCEAAALVLLNEPQDGWVVTKSMGFDSANPGWTYQVAPLPDTSLLANCLRSGGLQIANDGSHNPAYDPACDGLGELSVHNLLCAPLAVDGQVLGAIKLFNKHSGPFQASDQEALALIASQAALAFSMTRLIQQLKLTNADLVAGRWELLGSRNTLRALFDHLPASLYTIDTDYRLVAINRTRTQRLGQPPRLLVGTPCYQALFSRSEPCLECRVRQTLDTGQTTQRNERRYVGDDIFEWEINTYPIRDDNDRIIQAVLMEQDVSERRRLEAILTQSEKLAAIGQLAAGVAHEINNPLTAIIANAQILHRELPPNSDLQESVDLISRAGARATQVVRNLLDFARKEEYHLGVTDPNETIERALELIQHELLSRGVHLEFDPDPNLPPILASQDHLQSVWLNLILNAIDSLDKTPAEIRITSQRVGDDIQVKVADNGKGIPSDRLTRIFEPFYTTKAAGRGTGLGLSVSHRIIRQHGGRIGVESQVGVGSTFTIVLPTS